MIRSKDGVVLLEVFVQPRAARNAVGGEYRGALKVRTTAPPADGKANAAVEVLIAKWLDIPRSGVSVVSGHSSRAKRLALRGIEEEEVRAAAARSRGQRPSGA